METLFIGKNLIFLPETDSTNSYASHLLKNVNPPEGTVVYTAFQASGKGQRGNAWQSEPLSNLMLSVILKPDFLAPTEQFYLYQFAALACYDTLAALMPESQYDIKIKWPNDMLVNRKKIAGILIESQIQGGVVTSAIVGIGININQENFGDLQNATSLKLLTGKNFATQHALAMLCGHLEKYYLHLRNRRVDLIRENYLAHLFGHRSKMTFKTGDSQRTLTVMGVGRTGLLQLRDENGTDIEADVKQLRWIY